MKDHARYEIGRRGRKLLIDLFWIALAFGMLIVTIVMLGDRAHAQCEIPIGFEQSGRNLLGRASGLDRGFRDVCGSSAWQPGLSNAHSSDAGGNLTKTGAPSKGVEASHHRFLDKTNLTLFAGVATMRALDLHSTWKLRRNGWNEYVLPARLVDSKPAFTAFSVGMVAAHVGGCYLLHRTGHHRMERIASAVHIATGAAAAANNYWWVHQ